MIFTQSVEQIRQIMTKEKNDSAALYWIPHIIASLKSLSTFLNSGGALENKTQKIIDVALCWKPPARNGLLACRFFFFFLNAGSTIAGFTKELPFFCIFIFSPQQVQLFLYII